MSLTFLSTADKFLISAYRFLKLNIFIMLLMLTSIL